MTKNGRGTCSENYPKDFSEDTFQDDNGFFQYRRPDDGETARIRARNADGRFEDVSVTNQNVVPYNGKS